jgi:hypothetical protein
VEPLTKRLSPSDPRSLCPLSSTEFVESPRTKFLGTPLSIIMSSWHGQGQTVIGIKMLYVKIYLVSTVHCGMELYLFPSALHVSGFIFTHLSQPGVQFRRLFRYSGYGVSARAEIKPEPLPKLYTCV